MKPQPVPPGLRHVYPRLWVTHNLLPPACDPSRPAICPALIGPVMPLSSYPPSSHPLIAPQPHSSGATLYPASFLRKKTQESLKQANSGDADPYPISNTCSLCPFFSPLPQQSGNPQRRQSSGIASGLKDPGPRVASPGRQVEGEVRNQLGTLISGTAFCIFHLAKRGGVRGGGRHFWVPAPVILSFCPGGGSVILHPRVPPVTKTDRIQATWLCHRLGELES